MRRGELLGLRWEDLDLANAKVSVTQSLVLIGDTPTIQPPKTAKGARRFSLDAETVAVLKAHRKRQLEERVEWGEAYADSGLVFQQENGEPVHPHTFSTRFTKLSEEAGLPKIRLHDVRHSAATLALELGMDVKVVSTRLGHSSVDFTRDQYMHVLDAVDERAAEQVGAALWAK